MVLHIVRQLLKIQMALDDLHSWTSIQAKDPGYTSIESKTFFGDQRGWVGLEGLGGGPLLFVAAEQPEEAAARQMPY